MKEAEQITSIRPVGPELPTRGPLGSKERPPRFRVKRPASQAASPSGIADTVGGVLALPVVVMLELGRETMRTLRSIFTDSVRRH